MVNIFRNIFERIATANFKYISDDLRYLNTLLDGFIINLNLVDNICKGEQPTDSVPLKKLAAINASEEYGDSMPMDIQVTNAVGFMKKIRGDYKHKEVASAVNSMLENYIIPNIKIVIDLSENVKKLIGEMNELVSVGDGADINALIRKVKTVPEYIKSVDYGIDSRDMLQLATTMYIMFDDIRNICTATSVFIVDSYFIRRFMDKDYVTNGVSYTGAMHSSIYVYMLVKHFGFEVTHASYSQYDIKTLNSKIKNGDLDSKLYEDLAPPEIRQCSNMSSFPKNFT